MKKILYLIKNKRPLQLRLLALFLILIYLPILFNVFFIQRQTVSAVKEDKLVSIEESLKKTGDSLDQTAARIGKLLEERSRLPGVQKGVEDYHLLPEQAQANFHDYMNRQLTDIDNASVYVRQSSIFTLEGDRFVTEDVWHENFGETTFYQDLLAESLEDGWHFLPVGEVYRPDYIESSDEYREHSEALIYVQGLQNLEGNALVGYILSTIDQRRFSELYENVFIGEGGDLSLWSDKTQSFLMKDSDSFPEDLRRRIFDSENFTTEERDGASITYYSVLLDSFPGRLIASIPESTLTQSIEGPLRLNLYLMILISTLISIWVFVEIIIISNIATQKETASYRLTLSEELNEKLRMYKHDFSNHLQIIQGLIQLGHSDRALKYLKKISGQGKMIYDNYEIGIPELEVVLYDALLQAKERDIEVHIQTTELPSSIPISIYDLVKALSNLIKNAFEAMEPYPDKHRVLSIKIFEEKDDYVFKISNNLPLIPKEDQNRIFEKGFTTKKSGDGFGLYMVQDLIEKHQGSIDLVVDDEGNHFFLRLPKE